MRHEHAKTLQEQLLDDCKDLPIFNQRGVIPHSMVIQPNPKSFSTYSVYNSPLEINSGQINNSVTSNTESVQIDKNWQIHEKQKIVDPYFTKEQNDLKIDDSEENEEELKIDQFEEEEFEEYHEEEEEEEDR